MDTDVSCLRDLKQKQTRRPFSDVEDMILKALVAKYGELAWGTIACNMSGRTPRQCRERWLCFIGSRVVREPWSLHEDATLLSAYERLGPSWKNFETLLPGRKSYAIRNRVQLLHRRMANLRGRANEMLSQRLLAPPVPTGKVVGDPACARNSVPELPQCEAAETIWFDFSWDDIGWDI